MCIYLSPREKEQPAARFDWVKAVRPMQSRAYQRAGARKSPLRGGEGWGEGGFLFLARNEPQINPVHGEDIGEGGLFSIFPPSSQELPTSENQFTPPMCNVSC